MNYFWLALIAVYQRFISPFKGFHCAHHALYGNETCSNAVKNLVRQHGLISALPDIKTRFAECRAAFRQIQLDNAHKYRGDLPCDLPCDASVGDCSGSDSKAEAACECLSYCDWPFESRRYRRRTKQFFLLIVCLAVMVLAYVYHGRDINTIYVVDHGVAGQGIVKNIIQRETPALRVVAFYKNKKMYSGILEPEKTDAQVKLMWSPPLPSFELDRLEIHDARLSLGNEQLVLGQVLETFENPLPANTGDRFSYRIKRRWHF